MGFTQSSKPGVICVQWLTCVWGGFCFPNFLMDPCLHSGFVEQCTYGFSYKDLNLKEKILFVFS